MKDDYAMELRNKVLNNKMIPISLIKIMHSSGAIIALYANIIIKSSELKSNFWVGSYAAVLSVLYAIMMIIGGRLADKYSGKKVLLFVECISVCCILLYMAFDKTRYLPLCFAIVSSLYNLSTPVLTLSMLKQQSNVNSASDSNSIFSILLITSNIGIAIWSFVISKLPNIKGMLWILLAVNIVIALTSFGLPDVDKTSEKEEEKNEKESNSIWNAVKWMVINGRFLLAFTLLMITFSINLSHLNVSISIFVDDTFREKGNKYFSYIIIENAMILIFFTWIIHRLTRRFKEVFRLVIASIMYMITFGIFIFSRSLTTVCVAIFFFSCGEIISNTTGNTFVLERTPKEYTATFNSLYNVLSGSGTVIGPLISTILLEKNGINAVWLFSIILSVCTIMIFITCFKEK